MKVRLKIHETLESLYSEDDLKDLPVYESIYSIRILKSLVESMENGFIEVTEVDGCGQVFYGKYNVWLSHFDFVL